MPIMVRPKPKRTVEERLDELEARVRQLEEQAGSSG
jgi:polyhydroxyalkanoate synthesis regulator phasin